VYGAHARVPRFCKPSAPTEDVIAMTGETGIVNLRMPKASNEAHLDGSGKDFLSNLT
jgi:hypothetical protein